MIVLPWPATFPGVYRIDDTKTGRFYIGSSINIARRWSQHRQRLEAGTHPNPILQAIWSKDRDRLKISALVRCKANKVDLLSVEQEFLNSAGVGSNRMCMNVLPVAGSPLGRKRSSETKAAMSRAQKGRVISPEAREKMRAAKIGRPLTDEHKRKIGAKSKGRPGPIHSDEMLSKMRKYKDEQVSRLRNLVANGSPLLTAAKLCGISRPTARRIVSGDSYART